MSELILYTTEDGRSQIKLRDERQTVRRTPREAAEHGLNLWKSSHG